MSKFLGQFMFVLLVFLMMLPAVTYADELVIYSARKEHLIQPLIDAYSTETGTSISFITDKEGPLLQRLKAEGKNTHADLLITVDAGNLWHAASEGMLQKVSSATLEKNIPAHWDKDVDFIVNELGEGST